jgi:bifunctional non-homologous end joining protein LigD
MGLEGVVSNRTDAPYRSGQPRDAFVVIGFDPEPGGVAALRLAREVDGKLVYAGKVGTGFTRKGAAELRKTLDKLARTTSPVPACVSRRRGGLNLAPWPTLNTWN